MDSVHIYEAALSLLGRYFNNDNLYRHYALNVKSNVKCIKISLRQFALDILNELGLEPDGLSLERIMKIIAVTIIPSLPEVGFRITRTNANRARYIICQELK